ncbi:MAG: lipase [Pseudomonadota bacterium]
MGAWRSAAARAAALCVSGLALSGCAIFPTQPRELALVRVGDTPLYYPAYQPAADYLIYAALAARAYDDPGKETNFGPAQSVIGKRLQAWILQSVPIGLNDGCPQGYGPLCRPVGGLGMRLWTRHDGRRCLEAVIAFRGTDFSSIDDWVTNLHWFNRGLVFDQYDQARLKLRDFLRVAETLGCKNRIIAVGHSLGGGLAQHVAHLDRRIRAVYAFDSSPVVGSRDIDPETAQKNLRGLRIDHVYEHGEILAYLRLVARTLHPYDTCNPRVRTIRFNIASGSIINQHRIVNLTQQLLAISSVKKMPEKPPAYPPMAAKRFNLGAGCGVPSALPARQS